MYGIPPTVAIEQRLSRGGRKSTVGTTTEVWHFLRLLYVKLGIQHCTHDGTPVQPQTPDSIVAQLMTQFRGQHIGLLAPLVINRKGVYTELADWARPRGYTHLRVDGDFLPTQGFPRIDRFKEHNIELPVASLDVLPSNEADLRQALSKTLEHGKGVVHVLSDLGDLREAMFNGESTARIGQHRVFSTLRACPQCATSYAELDPRLFSYTLSTAALKRNQISVRFSRGTDPISRHFICWACMPCRALLSEGSSSNSSARSQSCSFISRFFRISRSCSSRLSRMNS